MVGATVILALIVGSIWFGREIAFTEQMPIYEGLRTTSSIIFAVSGAWITILYPEKLSKAFGKKVFSEPEEDLGQINKLFKPLLYSTVVLAFVIIVSFIVPLARHIAILLQYKEIFRSISFCIIGILTCLQLWSLILTIIPTDLIKDDLDGARARQQMLNNMRPGGKGRIK